MYQFIYIRIAVLNSFAALKINETIAVHLFFLIYQLLIVQKRLIVNGIHTNIIAIFMHIVLFYYIFGNNAIKRLPDPLLR